MDATLWSTTRALICSRRLHQLFCWFCKRFDYKIYFSLEVQMRVMWRFKKQSIPQHQHVKTLFSTQIDWPFNGLLQLTYPTFSFNWNHWNGKPGLEYSSVHLIQKMPYCINWNTYFNPLTVLRYWSIFQCFASVDVDHLECSKFCGLPKQLKI